MPQQPTGDWFDQNAPAKDLFDRAAASNGHPLNQNQSAAADVFDQAAAYTDQGGKPDWFEQNAPGRTAAPKLQQPVKVQSSLTDRLLGGLSPDADLYEGESDRKPTKGAGSKQGDLPGFEGSYASGDTDKGAFISSAGAAAGTALVGLAAAPRTVAAAKALGSWISSNPVKSYLAYQALKDLLPKSVHDLFHAAQKSPD